MVGGRRCKRSPALPRQTTRRPACPLGCGAVQ
jgi:hypothetical protein